VIARRNSPNTNVPYEWCEFINLRGTAAAPIVITNDRRGTIYINDDSFKLGGNSQHVVVRGDFDGTVPPTTSQTDTVRYGIIIDHSVRYLPAMRQAQRTGGTLAPLQPRGGIHVYGPTGNLSFSQIGLYNISAWSFRMNDTHENYGRVVITHCKMSGATYEAIYLGNSTSGSTAQLDSARMEHLIIENIWNNAIQVSRGVRNAPVIVRNCTFRNIAVNQNIYGQLGAVIFSHGCNFLVENNTMQNINGSWLQAFSMGGTARNNVVVGNGGVYWINKSAFTATTLNVVNNTMVIRQAIQDQGFPTPEFRDVFAFWSDEQRGQGFLTNNLIINTSPGVPGVVNINSKITVSGNYYATQITSAAGFNQPNNRITLPANAIGAPSFQSDLRVPATHANATKGTNFTPLRWPSLSADTQPPSIPSRIGGTPGPDRVNVNWGASTDNVGVTRYLLYVAGFKVDSVNSPTLTKDVIGLIPNTSYPFSVRARDAAGNIGPPIHHSFRTLAGLPTTPTLSLGMFTPTSAQLNIATPSTSNGNALHSYIFYQNNVEIGRIPVNQASYVATNLSANTSYSFTVRAVDIQGNLSPVSAALTARTAIN
jgi:chitodextrinase